MLQLVQEVLISTKKYRSYGPK